LISGRLRWFGHVERKPVDDWVKNCQKLTWMVKLVKAGVERHDLNVLRRI